MKEIWKAVPGFPGYEVSNFGRVKSLKRNEPRMLSLTRSGNDYIKVGLIRDGKQYLRTVHRLVALAFLGPCPEGMEVCHNDDNKRNNALDNLRYDTHKNNIWDALKSGKFPIGERTGLAGLTNEQASEIKMNFPSEFYNTKIAKEFAKKYNVSSECIRLILLGKTYKEAIGPIVTAARRTLTNDEILKLRNLASDGYSLSQLAKKFNRDPSVISRTINGEIHCDIGGPIKGIDY